MANMDMPCVAADGRIFPRWIDYCLTMQREQLPVEDFQVVTAPPEHRGRVAEIMRDVRFYPSVPDDCRYDLPLGGGWEVRFKRLLALPTNAEALEMVREVIYLTARWWSELVPFVGARLDQMSDVLRASQEAEKREIRERGFGTYFQRHYSGDSGATNWTYEKSWWPGSSPSLLRQKCLPEICAYTAHHVQSRNYHLRVKIPEMLVAARRADWYTVYQPNQWPHPVPALPDLPGSDKFPA